MYMILPAADALPIAFPQQLHNPERRQEAALQAKQPRQAPMLFV
jgi:hypothetical protein